MASDLHLKIDGIEGDSRDSGHDKEIEITSYSSGVQMTLSGPGSSGSATTERATFTDFMVTKNVDKSTVLLILALAKGTVFANITLSVERPDGKGGKVKYLEIQFADSVLSSYASSHGGSGLPSESISFASSKIQWVYTPTDPATGDAQGNVAGGWDLGLNKPV